MTVIRDVIRDVVRPVIRDVIRDSSGGGTEPGAVPTWSFVGPTFQVYEYDLPFTLDMNPYVSTPVGEPVTGWSNTGSATIGAVDGILSLNQAVGSYPITVTATNINGPSTSNQFTIEVLAGEQPAAPEWDTVPNYYSVQGIEEGNRVPAAAAAAAAATIYAAGEGVDMHEFILNHPTPWPVTPGSWIVSPGNVATIDADGILKGKAGTVPGQYSLTVTCSNAHGSATSASFTWTVVSQDGYSVDFDKASIHPDLNGLTHTRGADQTFLNHLADPTTTVTGDVEALVGQDWNGSAYTERNVGYGILMERNLNTLEGALQVLPGMELEACGHLIFRLERLPLAGESYRYFTLGNDDPSDYSEVYIASGATDDTFTLGVRTLVGNAEEVTTPTLTLAVGDMIDLRYKVNGTETDKLTLWYSINNSTTSVVAGQAYPAELQTKAATRVGICGQGDGTATLSNTANVIHVRLVPTGYLDNTTILGWSTWEHPAPIFKAMDPPDGSLHFEAEEPVDPPVEPPPVGDTPARYINLKGSYYQQSWALVDEGETVLCWVDVADAVSVEWKIKPIVAAADPPYWAFPPFEAIPFNLSGPQWEPLTDQIAGVDIRDESIPPTDPPNWPVSGLHSGTNYDQSGRRYSIRFPAVLGDDCYLESYASGDDGIARSSNFGRGRQVRIREAAPWADFSAGGSLYAMWRIEERDYTYGYPKYGDNQDKGRGPKWGDQYQYHTKYDSSMWRDQSNPDTYHLISIDAMEGAGGQLVPHGPDPLSQNGWFYTAAFGQLAARAACTNDNDVGLRHSYAAPVDLSGGYTVGIPCSRYFANDAGTFFELVDEVNASVLRVFTDGDGDIKLSAAGNSAVTTDFSIDPCEVQMLTVSIDGGNISVWCSPLAHKSSDLPGTVFQTTDNDLIGKSVGAVSFYADCGASDGSTAPNAAYGIFGLAAIYHRAFADSDARNLALTVLREQFYKGVRYGSTPDGEY